MLFQFVSEALVTADQFVWATKHFHVNEDDTLPGRFVVVGDIHGCSDELKDLLKAGPSMSLDSVLQSEIYRDSRF